MNNSVPIELTEGTYRKVTFQVLCDMDADGTYEVDLTSDVESIDYISNELEQKDRGMVLGKPSANEASITLLNGAGKYSPNNAANIESMYPGNFRRNTKIKILAGFIDANGVPQTRNLFEGVIVEFKGKIALTERKMTLRLRDFVKFAAKKKNPNNTLSGGITYAGVLFNVTLSDAVTHLIDYCYGSSFPRDIHTLTTVYPIIEFPKDQTVWSTIQKIAEACDAKAYFEEGVFKFYSPLSEEGKNAFFQHIIWR
jgi:hypothetical protein